MLIERVKFRFNWTRVLKNQHNTALQDNAITEKLQPLFPALLLYVDVPEQVMKQNSKMSHLNLHLNYVAQSLYNWSL